MQEFGKVTMHADGEDVTRRLFSFENPMSLVVGFVRAQRLVRGDPALKSAGLVEIDQYGHGIAVNAGEPGDWVSSSVEAPGIERQVHVHSQIGGVSLSESEPTA